MLSEKEKQERDERLFELTDVALNANKMDMSLYQKFDVKRGLRESNGRGVLTGLTEISDVNGHKDIDGESVPIEGEQENDVWTVSIEKFFRGECKCGK